MKEQLAMISAVLLCGAILSGAEPQVDRFGQFTGQNWPDKVTAEEELAADAGQESALLRPDRFDSTKFDRFGGRLDAGKFEATGRFYKRKIDGRWWLITPEGHRYFMIGCDAVDYKENGYSTPVNGPDAKLRPELAGTLADPENFSGAYTHGGSKFNYLAANLQRKYGPEFREKSLENTRRRLIDWGFNSSAKWGWGTEIGLPYFEDLTFRTVRRFGRCIDPFDPEFAAKAEPEIAAQVARRKADPMMVAYATENENGWNFNNIDELTAAPADLAAKQVLVDRLIDTYGEEKAAQLFGVAGGRTAMLANRKTVRLPHDDAAAMIRAASVRYHETLAGIYRKLDPDHMWFAASHCPGQSMEWIHASAPYVDAFMLNEYDLLSPWILGQIDGYRRLDVPFVVTEFSFTTDSRGMPPRWETNNVRSQRERGLAYRHYTEQLAAQPECIGFGYFIYYDQPVTMRSLPDGENQNFGLVSQQDRPHREMIDEVKKSNARLEQVHAGAEAPFALRKPAAILNTAMRDRIVGLFLPESLPDYLTLEFRGNNRHFHNRPRIKINEQRIKSAGTYAFGTIDLADKKASGIVVTGYSWNPLPKLADGLFLMTSVDGKHFQEQPMTVTAGRAGSDFTEYFAANAEPFPAGTRYLKVGLRVKDPAKSWAVLLCGVELK